MNINGEPYVIEYNVRMGDPETQVVIPRINNDLVDILISSIDMNLKNINIKIRKNTASTVILSAEGYPEKYKKGLPISGFEKIENTIIFHAGTIHGTKILTNGGRVIACTGIGKNLSDALHYSYKLANKIIWEGKYYRKDIGKDLLR